MNTDERSDLPFDWEGAARGEMHPHRFSILHLLMLDGGRTLSPTECAFELQVEPAEVNYHFKVLERRRLIRMAHTIPVRGTTEHFYCLIDHDAADLFERLEDRE